jgi:hypothetical protein
MVSTTTVSHPSAIAPLPPGDLTPEATDAVAALLPDEKAALIASRGGRIAVYFYTRGDYMGGFGATVEAARLRMLAQLYDDESPDGYEPSKITVDHLGLHVLTDQFALSTAREWARNALEVVRGCPCDGDDDAVWVAYAQGRDDHINSYGIGHSREDAITMARSILRQRVEQHESEPDWKAMFLADLGALETVRLPTSGALLRSLGDAPDCVRDWVDPQAHKSRPLVLPDPAKAQLAEPTPRQRRVALLMTKLMAADDSVLNAVNEVLRG